MSMCVDDDELGRIARRDWLQREQGFDTKTTNYSGATIEARRREAAAKRWRGEFSFSGALTMSERDITDLADYFATELTARRVATVDLETGYKLFIDAVYPENMAARSRLPVLARIQIFNFPYYALRLCNARWWRAQLRRWAVQTYEAWAIDLGKVGAAQGAWYCSDRALSWRTNQLEKAEAMMRATMLENEGGEAVTLWDAAKSTVANKSNRRDELMTRIRGCGEWADAQGMACMFTTNTAPSRFHAQLKSGGKNKKYDGSNPAQAQAWLTATWARCRAQLHREGLRVMGFRVAEPHHDGCPHWHMMIFVKPIDFSRVSEVMRGHWLREPERGSDTNRIKIVKIDKCKGTAAGYIAKYIAKNIDDYQISHHRDDDFTDAVIEQSDSPARRVDAWASCWRIRQFQAIGQPPVTVWRELRRTTKEAAAGGSDTLIIAWLAVHRKGEKMACWNSYMAAQGGAMCKRKDYKLCTYAVRKIGKLYGDKTAWYCGVREPALVVDTVTPTKRQSWGGVGFGSFCTANEVNAWTRLNNCTRARAANRSNLTKTLDAWQQFKNPKNDEWEIDDDKARHCDDFWASIVIE
jgi:Bacteriophage replication gene A protein (GPA)